MRSQGFGHAAFIDRLGDTFRWKGENVATTEVEAAISTDPQVEEATVFGVEVPAQADAPAWRPFSSRRATNSTVRRWPRRPTTGCPAMPCRCSSAWSSELAHTSTFKSQKVDLRKEGYGGGSKKRRRRRRRRDRGPVYVLAGRDEGYIPFYDEYPEEVKDGKRPKN